MPISTRELSKIAKISEQSVRNYTREYSTLLSPAARGEGVPRVFSDEDVSVLCSIASLRREGVPPAEVVERLQRGDVYIEATPNSPQATPTPSEGPQALMLVRSDLQRQINALARATRRMEEERATERRNDKLQGALWGAIAALVAGGFVLWVLYLLGG